MRKILLLFLTFILSTTFIYAQEAPTAVREAGLTALRAALNTNASPSSWTYLIERSRNSSLGCPFVTGTTLANELTVYNFSFVFATGSYSVRVSADASIVQLCDEKLINGAIATPTDPTNPNPCYIRPNADFSNVRAAPSTDEGTEIIGQITGQTIALGRNAENTWYRIQIGWVAMFVVESSGNCANLPIMDVNTPISITGSTVAATEQINRIVTPYCYGVTINAGTAQALSAYDNAFNYAANESVVPANQTMSEQGALYRVYRNGQSGWILESNLVLTGACEAVFAQAAGLPNAAEVCWFGMNQSGGLFAYPDNSLTISSPVAIGDRFTIFESQQTLTGLWYRVGDFKGKFGWVSTQHGFASEGCVNHLVARSSITMPIAICTATTLKPSLAYSDIVNNVTYNVPAGFSYLVVGQTQSDLGRLFRIIDPNNANTHAFIAETDVAFTPHCMPFLADAPFSLGADAVCYATLSELSRAFTDVDGLTAITGYQAFERYEVQASTTNQGQTWIRITTNEIYPSAWVNLNTLTLSEGCALRYVDSIGNLPANLNACVLLPNQVNPIVRAEPNANSAAVKTFTSPMLAFQLDNTRQWYNVGYGWIALADAQAFGSLCAFL